MSREAAAFSVILQPVSAAPGHPHPGEKELCQNSRSWHPDCRWIGCFFISSYRWRTDIGILPDTYSSRKQCCSCPANAPPFSRSYQSILCCRRSRQCQRERCFCRAAASKSPKCFHRHFPCPSRSPHKGCPLPWRQDPGCRNNRSLPAAGSRAAYLPRFLCCLFCCCIRSRNS